MGGAGLALSGGDLVAKLDLGALPTTLNFNQAPVNDGLNEYGCSATIDAQGDGSRLQAIRLPCKAGEPRGFRG